MDRHRSPSEDEIERALSNISPEDRDTWVNMGMAIKSELGENGFDIWNTWSEGGSSYKAKDAETVWKSLSSSGGVNIGSLFHEARKNGYRPSKDSPPNPQPSRQHAKRSPTDIWSQCITATERHPYIVEKQGVPDELKVVPKSCSIKQGGRSLAGDLVIPVYSITGELQSLQFIPEPGEGKKLNLAGSPMAEGMFILGKIEGHSQLYIAEGIGQAWAINTASKSPVVVTFGCGGVMKKVVGLLRKQYTDLRLVIVPDVGKEDEACSIARLYRALVACLPEGYPDNYDVNDYLKEVGQRELAQLLEAAKPPETRYNLLTGEDLAALPPLAWRIKGIFPAKGIAAIYGPSKSGKSFLSFDAACAIAEGEKWFGYRVNSAPVVMVALEGEAGYKLRADAWQCKHGRPIPKQLRIVMQSFQLVEGDDVNDLAEAIFTVVGQQAVVIIDTMNRAAPTADENSSKDMGQIIEGAKKLQGLTDGLVILCCHTGKDVSRGLRGHSSLIAALDAAIEVHRDNHQRSWLADKVKDGKDGQEHFFDLEEVDLGKDGYGDPLTSCVVVEDASAPKVKREKPLSKSERDAEKAYINTAMENGILDKDGKFIGVSVDAWRKNFFEIYIADKDNAKRMAFTRARRSFQDRGVLDVKDDLYRLSSPSIRIMESTFSENNHMDKSTAHTESDMSRTCALPR